MLLKTKLFIPQPPTNFVPRDRLQQTLDEGFSKRLTVVRAPAGFGKTSLVVDWLAQRGYPTGWLSLDSADSQNDSPSDQTRFTRHLIAAARTIHPRTCSTIDIDELTLALALNDVLPVLINDLSELSERSILVLDDYHLIDNAEIHAGVSLLLEHTPPNLHIILTARSVPALPLLPRLRVRGQMQEIDSADLRFTTDEAAQFMTEMGLILSTEQITTLEARTEGWVAGLQLAAISMQGRDDVAGFIDALSGRHQYIVDYLAEEALGQSSADVQQFLLQTCVLDRFSADLCNAVTQRKDSQQMLDQLRRQNLFIVALDDEGGWYRYHHFFDDFLDGQLERIAPDQIPALNERAARWFLEQGEISEAIRHLLLAEIFDAAAEQIATQLPHKIAGSETAEVSQWLKQLPATVIEANPALQIGYALTHVRQRDWRTAQREVEKVKRQITDPPPILEAVIYLIESEVATLCDDLPAAVSLATRSLALLEPSPLRTHIAHQLVGLYSLTGDLIAMRRIYEELATSAAPTVRSELSQLVEQADNEIAFGLLHEAMRLYRQGIQRATLANLEGLPIVGAMRVGMGRVLHEWGEWTEAETQLQQGLMLLEETTLSGARIVGMSTLHYVLHCLNKQDEAAQQLEQTGELIRSFNIQQLNALFAAVEAESALNRGDVEQASQWLRKSRLPLTGELVHLHTTEYRIMARVLLARGQMGEALTVLEAVEAAARAADQRLLLVEVLILRAIGLLKLKREQEAVDVLRQGVESAESQSYIRPFLDYPSETAHLLYKIRHSALSGFLPDYIDDLLAALGVEETTAVEVKSTVDVIPLLDPLTDRELDVLAYLVQGYSNQAIADAMFVAVSTTRTHLRNLYSKLDARSRTHAIVRARELNIVDE